MALNVLTSQDWWRCYSKRSVRVMYEMKANQSKRVRFAVVHSVPGERHGSWGGLYYVW